MLSYQNDYDAEAGRQWATRYWSQSLLISVVYVAFVFKGPNFMKARPAYDLKPVVFIWNVILAVFSILGVVELLPEFIGSWKFGFKGSYCRVGPLFDGKYGFWQVKNATKKSAHYAYYYSIYSCCRNYGNSVILCFWCSESDR